MKPIDGAGHHATARLGAMKSFPGDPPQLQHVGGLRQQRMGRRVGGCGAEHREGLLEAQARVALGGVLVDGLGIGPAEVEQGVGLFAPAALAQRVDFSRKRASASGRPSSERWRAVLSARVWGLSSSPLRKASNSSGWAAAVFNALSSSRRAPQSNCCHRQQRVQHLEALVVTPGIDRSLRARRR